MAYKLTLSTLVTGLEPENIKKLATFKFFSVLATPVTELVMRTALEAGQFQPYTDAGWLGVMTDLAATPFEESALTASEYSIVNTIREVVNPDPSQDCCGIAAPTSGSTSIAATSRTGSATFEHGMDVKLSLDSDCLISSIRVTLTPAGAEPVLISVNPFTAYFSNCTVTGRFFKYVWTEYGANPTGGTYDVNYDFRDADDVNIYTVNIPNGLIMP